MGLPHTVRPSPPRPTRTHVGAVREPPMRRYITKNNIVTNVIELEDDAVWSPPEGHTLEPKSYVPPAPTVETIPDEVPALTMPTDAHKTKYSNANTQAKKVDVIAEFLGLKTSS